MSNQKQNHYKYTSRTGRSVYSCHNCSGNTHRELGLCKICSQHKEEAEAREYERMDFEKAQMLLWGIDDPNVRRILGYLLDRVGDED